MNIDDSMSDSRPVLIDFLLEDGAVEEKDVDAVFQYQAKENCRLENALLATKVVSDTAIAESYAGHLDIPLISLNETKLDSSLLELLPEKFMRDARVVPVRREDDALHVAMVDPSDLSVSQDVQFHSSLAAVSYVASVVEIDAFLDRAFGTRDVVKEIASEVDGEEESVEYDDREGDVLDLDKLVTDDRDSQVIRMVNYVMRQAIEQRASDIHIEPLSESVSIRYRVDGELQAKPAPPKSMFTSLVSRLKILSKLDIAERRLPQDGAFSMLFKQNQIDVRVSTVPTVYGEKVVMRLLNKNGLSLDHKTLGFNDKQCASFIATSKSPHGLIFVTGPTGSGKSTTLYATLNLLNSPTKNLVTVEDPVEYKMDGINQVQVHAAIGLTFAGALRSFLRQDPDVIMVGEVRDQETAEICLRAALTGHLVLSTLHTNNALAAIDRLVDMGIEPFLVASTLRLVEAQRLIRRLCDECKEAYVPAGDVCEEYGLEPGTELYHAKGCDACGGLGYRGRVGIFEVIQITAKLRDMIQAKAPLAEVQAVAEEEGMQSLLTNGLEKVRDGITSLDELCKATMEGDE